MYEVKRDRSFLLQCLMMFQVPYMEDVRQYTFASLPGTRKQFEPSGMLCELDLSTSCSCLATCVCMHCMFQAPTDIRTHHKPHTHIHKHTITLMHMHRHPTPHHTQSGGL